ncbi:hypothetical protein GCM10023188_37720 [Pontibacter saemangeumensis]|uniref:Uncharacterized protein n=1 Tax=Pontibacter saemangeumensis TaxID=1084525 RepID=A0ABP8LYI2_9BACT
MKTSFTDAMLARTGKLYLQLRLGKQKRVQQVLDQKYEGQYRNAGLVLLFDLLMAFAAVAVVCLIAVILYMAVTHTSFITLNS